MVKAMISLRIIEQGCHWTSYRVIGKVAVVQKQACPSFRYTDYTATIRYSLPWELYDFGFQFKMSVIGVT
jgi:hypothetical protein